MNKEQSFLAKWATACRRNELLRLEDGATVKVKVKTIVALCKDFHATGYDDGNNALSYIEKILGK